MGVLGTITQACYIKGMAEGDAAVMAPIDYTRLVFAVVSATPCSAIFRTRMTMLGAGIVIASTALHHAGARHSSASASAAATSARGRDIAATTPIRSSVSSPMPDRPCHTFAVDPASALDLISAQLR